MRAQSRVSTRDAPTPNIPADAILRHYHPVGHSSSRTPIRDVSDSLSHASCGIPGGTAILPAIEDGQDAHPHRGMPILPEIASGWRPRNDSFGHSY